MTAFRKYHSCLFFVLFLEYTLIFFLKIISPIMSKFITFQVVYFSTGQCQWKITTFEGTLESERESKTFFFCVNLKSTKLWLVTTQAVCFL